MAEDNQPIIIKKIKKGGHGGGHGGSWKVAYADFVTAMMAFFLLLWLLSTTSDDTKIGIASFFEYPSMVSMAGVGGASTSMIDFGGATDLMRGEGDLNSDDAEDPADSPFSNEFEIEEQEQLEELREQIEDAIEKTPELSEFKDQVIMDIVPDGLRIQIVDKENRPMFDSGSAEMKSYVKKILHEIAPILNQVSNRLSISGHTDAKQYTSESGYSNWELSADRANACRRELIVGKLPAEKIRRVVGLASEVALIPENVLDPQNRRISMIVLKKQADDEITQKASSDTIMPTRKIKLPPIREVNRLGLENTLTEGRHGRSGSVLRYRSN